MSQHGNFIAQTQNCSRLLSPRNFLTRPHTIQDAPMDKTQHHSLTWQFQCWIQFDWWVINLVYLILIRLLGQSTL